MTQTTICSYTVVFVTIQYQKMALQRNENAVLKQL